MLSIGYVVGESDHAEDLSPFDIDSYLVGKTSTISGYHVSGKFPLNDNWIGTVHLSTSSTIKNPKKESLMKVPRYTIIQNATVSSNYQIHQSPYTFLGVGVGADSFLITAEQSLYYRVQNKKEISWLTISLWNLFLSFSYHGKGRHDFICDSSVAIGTTLYVLASGKTNINQSNAIAEYAIYEKVRGELLHLYCSAECWLGIMRDDKVFQIGGFLKREPIPKLTENDRSDNMEGYWYGSIGIRIGMYTSASL